MHASHALWRRAILGLAASLLLLVSASSAFGQESRYFPLTGYHVNNDLIWGYFSARGGVDTFGYPVSNTFRFRGFDVQIFQRHMVQVVGGEARPVNLLDPTFLPLTRYNGSTFPGHDASVAAAAPAPDAANYGQAVEQYLNQSVPNNWEGVAVGLRDYYYSAVPASISGPRALLALEVWGFPTSAPARDPNNHNFIYQRFQRGIMHHDTATGVTRGILLGDLFKSVLQGQDLPADLAAQVAGSPFLGLYAPEQPNSLARSAPDLDPPITAENSDLTDAFVPGAGAAPGEVSPVALQQIASGFAAPVFLTEAPDGTGRLFVVDQVGQIRIIERDGTLREQPFLDVRGRMVGLRAGYDERGLLGLAFHPDYEENGRFFVYYSAPRRPSAPEGWDHTSHLSEFRVSPNPDLADAGSERIIMQVDQPQSNHNGGMIGFGPDGFLYVALGDGGGANDTGAGHPVGGHGQNRSTLLGSILRIDVNGAQPYTIPADNPFVSGGGAPEIYAYGFRNPYRFSWDRADGSLYVADAGQNLYEEISRVVKGGNYGWNLREGTHCFNPASPSAPSATCPAAGASGEPLLGPVIEYPHQSQGGVSGLVTVGGYMYRGDAIPELRGRFLFADWSASFDAPAGRLLLADVQEGALWSLRSLPIDGMADGRPGAFILSLSEDARGELYVLTTRSPGPAGSTGAVYRVIPPH